MKTNRKSIAYLLIWISLFAVFNVVCFILYSEIVSKAKDTTFWISYVAITLAFIGQLICSLIAFNTDDNKKLFYNIPIVKISYTGLILMVIFSAICTLVPYVPNWVGVIICVFILAVTIISVVKSKVAADIVSDVDNKIKAQTFFVKSLTVDAESLIAHAKSKETKLACEKVYEAVRYSDPMSNDALNNVEKEITLKFQEFKSAINNNANNSLELANELIALIDDRNKKCKLFK